MASFLWKIITSRSDEAVGKVMLDSVFNFFFKRRAELNEDGLDSSIWTKKEPEQHPTSWFSLKSPSQKKKSL